ncbi:MAG: FlgD immunoglobulin-like domain containing protein [Candidatus Edwardsbacteria bacterium]
MGPIVYLVKTDAFGNTGIEEKPMQNAKFPVQNVRLYQNYPNPFSSQTTICYSLSAMSHEPSAISHTTLKVYNVAGQLVKTLVGQASLPAAGIYTCRWDGRDESGKCVASGVYFYRLVTSPSVPLPVGEGRVRSETKKMVLLR